MLGYIPDRAYYFTVNRTLQLGLLVWSPINFCSNENETLPCPAPLGALVPWHESPTELALPQARTDGRAVQLGTKILYIGGTDGDDGAVDGVRRPDIRDRQFRQVGRRAGAPRAAQRRSGDARYPAPST